MEIEHKKNGMYLRTNIADGNLTSGEKFDIGLSTGGSIIANIYNGEGDWDCYSVSVTEIFDEILNFRERALKDNKK